MTWYPDINDLKSYYLLLKKKYSDLEKEHILGDGERKLKGILDSLRYGLPMGDLDFWLKTVLFLRDLVCFHCYSEGNHRFAYESTISFLEENGYLVGISEEAGEGEKLTRLVGDELAEGNPIRNFKPIAKWLKSKCEKK